VGLVLGVLDFAIGEDFARGWTLALSGPLEKGVSSGRVPNGVRGKLEVVRDRSPKDLNTNGAKSWHAGSNAKLAQTLGVIGAPLILAWGIGHETVDIEGIKKEWHWQGPRNLVLDSLGDILANALGLSIGYLLSGTTFDEVEVAMWASNIIPGPEDPDPDVNGDGVPYRERRAQKGY
jgi:hypothetical protein